MKKINAILSNSTKEQYPVLINKLSDIIEPFALHAVGLPPVYVGLEVEQLTVKQSGESVYVFGIIDLLILSSRRTKRVCIGWI